MPDQPHEFVDEVLSVIANRGVSIALAVHPEVGVGLAVAVPPPEGPSIHDPAPTADSSGHDPEHEVRSFAFAADETTSIAILRAIENAIRPRWVLWSADTAVALTRAGLRLATCWDIAAVHRLLHGGWRADPALVWATTHDLALDTLPDPARTTGPDLFSQLTAETAEGQAPPSLSDGHLDPSWVAERWHESPRNLAMWATSALRVEGAQQRDLARSQEPERYAATARAESATALLCAEMTVDGLPLDSTVATALIATTVGVRPTNEFEAAAARTERDATVLRHLPDHILAGARPDLRSPGQVKSILRSVGIEVPDTRAWRLEPLRDLHPIIPALLEWRRIERVSTTYGYAWLDEHVGADDRLRGSWSTSDGAAGRMTASAGLHNLPTEMRVAVLAESGHVFVRADLGQIEPRVLAAVSGDDSLTRATADADMYQPVAERLSVDRATAKVAVLGAMYGQTTGHGAAALRGLRANYPVAMRYLEDADRAGQVGRELRTFGGRRIRMDQLNVEGMTDQQARARSAAQGRYARNATVQGAAAELFKLWAVTVRARGREMDARIVLCLHDELLVHVRSEVSSAATQLVAECLQEAARRWAPVTGVRFLADISVLDRWGDAKD